VAGAGQNDERMSSGKVRPCPRWGGYGIPLGGVSGVRCLPPRRSFALAISASPPKIEADEVSSALSKGEVRLPARFSWPRGLLVSPAAGVAGFSLVSRISKQASGAEGDSRHPPTC
jgi:hypothetical protein